MNEKWNFDQDISFYFEYFEEINEFLGFPKEVESAEDNDSPINSSFIDRIFDQTKSTDPSNNYISEEFSTLVTTQMPISTDELSQSGNDILGSPIHFQPFGSDHMGSRTSINRESGTATNGIPGTTTFTDTVED